MADDLESWLAGLDLAKYAGAFAENEVTLSDLPHLTDDDLKEIGLPVGPRRRLLAHLAGVQPKAPSVEQAGTPSPVHAADPSGAERRQLTVLFSDLVGSTALSADLDPEDMRQLIRAYQDAVAGIIVRFEGFVAKFMGDGVLAYFGYPKAHEDQAALAVRAGLTIVDAVARQATPDARPLAARVGIATGLVVVGDLIGTDAAREETVVGEAPNLAARLQSLAGPGEVVTSATTRRLLGTEFVLEEMGDQRIKGLADPVSVVRVVAERAVETRFEARGQALHPLVGRDQELALLLERWNQTKAGEAQGLLLVGEAGIGKSRIVRGFLDALGNEPHARVNYQCSPYQMGSALAPAIQQLRHAAHLEAGDSIAEQLDKLTAVLARGGAAETEIRLLAELLGLDPGDRWPPVDLPPAQRRQRILDALVNQMLGLARQGPALFVLEDAHWIDPTTLELVENLLDAVIGLPVMVLMTSRPDNQPKIAGHPHVTRLSLNRLARTGAAAIVARLAGDSLGPEMVDAIVAHTDGVPLFVEELTKAVLETGETSIPSSLHDSLMARLDRIPDVKEVAQVAACIGREFDHELLAEIVDLPEHDLEAALGQLASAELIFRRGTSHNRQYLFKHALVRDAAYESLLRSRRAALHGRIADALSRRGESALEILARHTEYAGRTEDAIDLWQRAGRLAVAQPAFREAIGAFEAAIRLCQVFGDDVVWRRREQEIQVECGQALLANLGYQAPETTAAFERALALAESIGEPDLLAPALYGTFASRYINAQSFGDYAERMRTIIATHPNDGHLCVNLRMLALKRFHAGEYRQCVDLVNEAIRVYDKARHRRLGYEFGHDPRSQAFTYRAWCEWHLGFADRALESVDEALSWAREVDHANTIGISLCYGMALTNIWRRDIPRVRAASEETIQLAEKKSLALWDTWSRIQLSWARLVAGEKAALA
ncbi:MAG: adenylate/guanylate cyclase domain-containing protein, partial [Reyranellaceae bacterium]